MPFRPLDTDPEASSLGVGAGSFESHQYIDVIHSSVRRFFLDGDGFALLDQKIKNSSWEGHMYILEVYIRYCFLEEMKKAFKVETQDEPYLADATEWRAASKADIFDQNVHAAVEEDDDEASETMSLESSASVSIRSFCSNSINLAHRLEEESRRVAFSSMIKSASTPALVSCEAGHSNKAVLHYLDRLEPPSRDNTFFGKSIREDTNTPANTARSSFKHVKVVEDPSVLWQYCQDMLVYHTVAAEKASALPEKALEFYLKTLELG